MKFNFSFGLLNVHALNLVIAVIEFLATGVTLSFFDLWASLAICFIYIIFYLFVLDANGIHLYIVFTPRTKWCAVTYSAMMGLFVGFYYFWAWALPLFS